VLLLLHGEIPDLIDLHFTIFSHVPTWLQGDFISVVQIL